MALLKTQRNELLRLIVGAGLSPAHFVFDNENEEVLNYIGPGNEVDEHGTGFLFRFDRNADHCGWAPGATQPYESEGQIYLFEDACSRFAGWLTNLKRETSAPDLWKDARELGDALAKVEEPREDDTSTDDVPLVGAERERLIEAVETVRRLVEARNDTDEQQKQQMLKTLEDVKGASGAVSRKWLTQAVLGAVIGVVIKGALTQENGLWLLSQLAHAMAAVHLFGDAAVKGVLGS